jgi:hypothetical protein
MTSIIAVTNKKRKQTGKVEFSDRETVYEYFKLIKNKDINRLLDLFADDATVYEPFSNIQGGLRGKNAIKSFLEIVLMANDGLQHKIEFEQQEHGQEQQRRRTDNKNKVTVTALVTFERGGTVQGRFEFELASVEMKKNYNSHRLKKIRSLYIQFIK